MGLEVLTSFGEAVDAGIVVGGEGGLAGLLSQHVSK